jgi:hypothetical protein
MMAPPSETTKLLPASPAAAAVRSAAPVFCCLNPEPKGCLVHPTKSDAFAALSLVFAALTFYYSIEGMSIKVAVLGILCATMAYCNRQFSSYQTAIMKEDIATMKEDIGTMKEDIGTIKEDIKQLPSLSAIAIENSMKKLMRGDRAELRV